MSAASDRKLASHVVAILRQHPDRDRLSLEEVDRLGQQVLGLLTSAVKCIHDGRGQFPIAGDVGELLYGAAWIEAARVWRESL